MEQVGTAQGMQQQHPLPALAQHGIAGKQQSGDRVIPPPRQQHGNGIINSFTSTAIWNTSYGIYLLLEIKSLVEDATQGM
jgi:hypothetical protein